MLSGNAIDADTVVLIVENEESDAAMLKEICGTAGFIQKHMWEANGLDQAIGMLNRGVVDLVLLDLALDGSNDPREAVSLLERWESECKKKNTPVIVVSGYIEAVKQVAQRAPITLIKKPGPSDAEREQFSNYLLFAIRAAIYQRSTSATFSDRIKQTSSRIASKFGSVHLHLAPGISISVESALPKLLVGGFVILCWVVTGVAFAKTQGWPVRTVVLSFVVAIATLGALMLLFRRRSR
jgi:CheY-like chemotaxis protein